MAAAKKTTCVLLAIAMECQATLVDLNAFTVTHYVNFRAFTQSDIILYLGSFPVGKSFRLCNNQKERHEIVVKKATHVIV
jgi:hypothetical protein